MKAHGKFGLRRAAFHLAVAAMPIIVLLMMGFPVCTRRFTAKATALMAQLVQHTQDGKLDLAESTLAQLDGMKGTLSSPLREKLDVARAALIAKKAAAGQAK